MPPNAHAIPRMPTPLHAASVGVGVGVGLVLVPDHGGHRDVEEEERGDELGDHGAVEGPLGELLRVEERRRRRVRVVLGRVIPAPWRRLDVLCHGRS